MKEPPDLPSLPPLLSDLLCPVSCHHLSVLRKPFLCPYRSQALLTSDMGAASVDADLPMPCPAELICPVREENGMGLPIPILAGLTPRPVTLWYTRFPLSWCQSGCCVHTPLSLLSGLLRQGIEEVCVVHPLTLCLKGLPVQLVSLLGAIPGVLCPCSLTVGQICLCAFSTAPISGLEVLSCAAEVSPARKLYFFIFCLCLLFSHGTILGYCLFYCGITVS